MQKASVKSLGRAIGRTTGTVLAGLLGGVVAGVAGAYVAKLLHLEEEEEKKVQTFVKGIVGNLTTMGIKSGSQALNNYLSPAEMLRLNDELQVAFREGLGEGLYDLGGGRCFPKAALRELPSKIVYTAKAEIHQLWEKDKELATEIVHCFQGLERAFDQQLSGADDAASQVGYYL